MSASTAKPADPRAALARTLCQVRRQRASATLRIFAQVYLPHYFQALPSRMHLELFDLLDEARAQRSARIAVAAPRGHAKSTIVSVAHVIMCICLKSEPFIVLASDTADQAQGHLSAVKKELEDNERLREDFPGACELPGVRPQPRRWRRDEVVTRNGVLVKALGAGEKIRGRRNREQRPSLIILDDVENEQMARSEDQRERVWMWLMKAVSPSAAPGANIIVAGTIVHYDSLLARLLDPKRGPGWTKRRHQAVIRWPARTNLWESWEAVYNETDEHEGSAGPAAARAFFESRRAEMLEGSEVLWPEREDLYTLMEIRIRDGRASFDSEKQNEPVNPEDCLFKESDLHFWEDRFGGLDELLSVVGRRGSFYGACDPSLGKAGRGRDDSAIITLLRDTETGVLYVIDADVRRRRPDQIIDDIIALYRIRSHSNFVMETNQFQDFLADELSRRSAEAGVYMPVNKVAHTSDKLGRIQSLQPLITSGTIRFSRRHTALLDQLRRFPLAAHDDGPDALQMAVEAARDTGIGAWWIQAGGDGDEDDQNEHMWTPIG